MQMVPTDEEKTKLQEAQSQFPDTPFAHAESFLLTLSSISELSARLNLWSFKMDYDNIEKVCFFVVVICGWLLVHWLIRLYLKACDVYSLSIVLLFFVLLLFPLFSVGII